MRGACRDVRDVRKNVRDVRKTCTGKVGFREPVRLENVFLDRFGSVWMWITGCQPKVLCEMLKSGRNSTIWNSFFNKISIWCILTQPKPVLQRPREFDFGTLITRQHGTVHVRPTEFTRAFAIKLVTRKRLFAKLIYNADSKIARRARFLDCFQDWLEQDFFKAVWTEIIRQMGLFRCFPMCTKKVWLDPRIPDGAGEPPVVPVFCKKSCFFFNLEITPKTLKYFAYSPELPHTYPKPF